MANDFRHVGIYAYVCTREEANGKSLGLSVMVMRINEEITLSRRDGVSVRSTDGRTFKALRSQERFRKRPRDEFAV